ncbi:radical SAM protein [Alphaproteobacteria bacterium]|nr:radical SAM protein [Alphaproteobacteria bacterium]
MKIKNDLSLIKNIYLKKYPISLVFFVTNRCNARCSFCFIDFDNPDTFKHELTLDEIDKFSKKLGPSLNNLNITGGEPFARKDFTDIVLTFFKNTSLDSVYITTNGSLTPRVTKFAKVMKEQFPDKKIFFSFSIDSFEDEHNRIRKVKNIFSNCIQSYREVSEISDNIQANIAITVTKENYKIVTKLYKTLKEKYGISSITAILVRDEGVYKTENEYKKLILEAYTNLTDLIKKDLNSVNFGYKTSLKSKVMNAKNKISYSMIKKTYEENSFISTCHAGKIFGVIKANGDVMPCEVLADKMGNIRDSDYDFTSIWLSDNSKKITNKIKKEKCFCTYECAWSFNILGNSSYHPYLLQKMIF